jgi:hypothetical protein|tara:strand:- start:234 stop:899 length:666 start_codon:yes stop_codon:yes gene_type:complete
MENEIISLLEEKASTKQDVYRKTQSVFSDLQKLLKAKSISLTKKILDKDKSIKVLYSSKGKFEAQLKFSGDTLLFHMHSNVFDFPTEHVIHKTKYVKEDNLRTFCGVIHIYNFLSDSLKYNRMNDEGYLIARIFVNKDYHFFVEGDKQLGFLFNDFVKQVIDKHELEKIIESAMIYSLNFDLQVPNISDINVVSVHQILQMNTSQKIRTAKRLGYKFSFEK